MQTRKKPFGTGEWGTRELGVRERDRGTQRETDEEGEGFGERGMRGGQREGWGERDSEREG